MIETLPERIAALAPALQQISRRILHVYATRGQTIVPPSMEAWVVEHFGALAAVREQAIVKVTNRLTLESALFNPIRARRPQTGGGDDAALEQWIARELAEHDIFADPERSTTADVFGRIRGIYSISASNVAKYDGWHGLVIFDDPHPLHVGPEQLRDALDVARRWVDAAHARDAAAIYPIITWNCLPKSGATLMHGHMQIALAHGMHYARIEAWRRAAASYHATTRASYFNDLAALHHGLGLMLAMDGATRAFAHLTPIRNREVVVLADAPTQGGSAPNLDTLATTLAAVLRHLTDEQGVRAFNLAIALPPLRTTKEEWHDMPLMARIADRGNPLANRSDVGAMELFAAGCITADPFEVAASFKQGDTI